MFFKVYTYVLHDILRLHKSSTLWPCSSTTPYPSASSYVMKTELGKAALYLYVLTWFECSSKIWLLFCWKCMKIALWFLDISQSLPCSSLADSDLSFIVVHSWPCLTVPSEDGISASSMTIPASLQSSQSLFLVIWYRRIPISFSRRGKGFLNDFEDLDFTCLSFHFLE